MEGLGMAKIRRTPYGRRSRVGEQKETAPATLYRARNAVMASFIDARWATAIGSLYLSGRLTKTEECSAEVLCIAGEKWANLAARCSSALCGPAGPRSGSMEHGSLGEMPDPDSEAGREIAEREQADRRALEEAKKALAVRGTQVETVVRAVCEKNELPGWYELPKLIEGLNALARHWRLQDQRSRMRASR